MTLKAARRRLLWLVAFCCLACAGCGISDPYAETQPATTDAAPKTTASAPTPAPADGDETSTVPAPEPVTAPASGGGAGSAADAAERYARAYANWTWRTAAEQNRRVLAALGVGSVRQAALANAQELGKDTTLARDRPANRGVQLALDVQGSDPGKRTVWIVMDETSSIAGHAAASDRRVTVYRLGAVRHGGRWYVEDFEPQR